MRGIFTDPSRYLTAYTQKTIGISDRTHTGESGEVDLHDMIFKYKVAAPLRDAAQFAQFKLDEWPTLAWDCGFDVSPETLYERATGKVIEWLNNAECYADSPPAVQLL